MHVSNNLEQKSCMYVQCVRVSQARQTPAEEPAIGSTLLPNGCKEEVPTLSYMRSDTDRICIVLVHQQVLH